MLKDCDGEIVKRFVNEQNNTTDDSLQVNVSAGYGIHSENSTFTTVFPVYRFQERKGQKENDTGPHIHPDQISQPSQTVKEVLPSPVYQVHEKSPEVQEKNFHVAKVHRHRAVDKRIRHKTEMRKPVNDMEHKPVVRQDPKLASGTRIVEVLRVPAMYELRLQSDPQRLAALNTAWLTKLMNQNHFKRPALQPAPQMNPGKNFALQPQASSVISYAQPPAGNSIPHQRVGGLFQSLKSKYVSPKVTGYQQSASSYGVNQHKSTLHPVTQVQSLGGYKHNYQRPQNYQSSYQSSYQSQNTATSGGESSLKKPTQETSTQAPLNYHHLSKEIPSDYYQKPQALHEVPAPVLNKHSYKQVSSPKVQPTAVPSLVYGKPIDPPSQFSTQSPVPASGSWSLQDQTNLNSFQQNNNYQYNQAPVDPIPNYYQQSHYDNLNSIGQESLASHHQPQYQNKNTYDSHGYQGYRNVQTYYNDAIGDSLDQSLSNVNGGVATYLNHDGTMTVSNFHHNPQLYRPPVDYEIPVSENTNLENGGHDFNMMGYQNQNNDLTDFDNQMYPGYSQEIPVTENQIETADNQGYDQGYGLQNHADLSNLLLATARSGVEEGPSQKYEAVNNYGRKYMAKRLYQKPFSPIKRNSAPVEYILFVKERKFG